MCRVLENQFPLRYQFSLGFFKSFRITAEVKLFNFQAFIQSRDFDSNFMKTQSLVGPEKVGGNHNICKDFQNISSLTDMLVLPQNFGKI